MNLPYSFLSVAASLVGPGGYISLGANAGASEEGITVSPTGEIGGMQIGAGGDGQHSLYADKSGKVTVRLLKTSPTNQLLGAMYALQTASPSMFGQNTLVINDTTRGDVITCQQVAFAKAPDLTFAKDAGFNDWEFNAIRIDRAFGGGAAAAIGL